MSGALAALVPLQVLAALAGASSAGPSYLSSFSCGHLFYRTLQWAPSGEVLWVGAMDHLFALRADDVNATNCEAGEGDALFLPASSTASAACTSKGKSGHFDCRNHIRVIANIGAAAAGGQDRLYVCGTNAHSPQDQVLYADLSPLERHEFFPGVGDGIAKCPFDPHDNSTAVWVSSGNPGGHPALYSGTNAEFTKADTVIFRGDIFDPATQRREYSFKRTIKYDSHMLDKPDFVGNFDVGPYVYYFFRETAVEYMNCGKAIYSRVARVCKNDVGGKNILHQNWATYLKARLNCSIPGEFPFFFNEIQAVFKAPTDDSVFHAVFTTSQNGLVGSAICSFQLDDIEAVFDGKFKEQATTTSVWLPVPSAKVPQPRPGACVPDTRKLPDTVLNFIRKHPLMDANVPHNAEKPVFYERDTVFTSVAYEQVQSREDATTYGVYYAGTATGSVYKVVAWRTQDADGNWRTSSKLLDKIPASQKELPIRRLQISPKAENRSLYATTDWGVNQIRLKELCAYRYDSCSLCIQDPTCGWDAEKGECSSRSERNALLFRDSSPDGGASMCEGSTASSRLTASFGESVHLQCGRLARPEGDVEVQWFHFQQLGDPPRKLFKSSDYVMTNDNGLVVMGVRERDQGFYECRWKNQLLHRYHLTVDAHRCAAPTKSADYQKAYSNWCQQFQKYKLALQNWEKRQNQCASTEFLMMQQNQGQGQVYRTTPLV